MVYFSKLNSGKYCGITQYWGKKIWNVIVIWISKKLPAEAHVCKSVGI